jgi:hypothetical protein
VLSRCPPDTAVANEGRSASEGINNIAVRVEKVRPVRSVGWVPVTEDVRHATLVSGNARPEFEEIVQLVRCYGRYSNVCQGRRKRMSARALQPDDHRAEGEDGQFRKQCRENWARLIKKILEVDPLICSKCQGVMKIISFIENPPVIHRILAHLDLWDVPKRSPPVSPPRDFIYDSDFFKGLVN